MPEPLLTVSNHHVPSCGLPPTINGDEDCYVGYFVNTHGEQSIFKYDRETKRAVVLMGDAGWEAEYQVVDGTARGLLVNTPELLWIMACWLAATS